MGRPAHHIAIMEMADGNGRDEKSHSMMYRSHAFDIFIDQDILKASRPN